MKIDFYTKVILTLICIFLGIIAFHFLLNPDQSIANTNKNFSYLQYGSYSNRFFNPQTGEIWDYSRRPEFIGRLVELGKPLEEK